MKENVNSEVATFENLPAMVGRCYEEILFMKSELKQIKENFEPKKPTEYLTRAQLKDMLKCDMSTIHNWTVEGKLKAYGIGNRVYYKRVEIDAALKPTR